MCYARPSDLRQDWRSAPPGTEHEFEHWWNRQGQWVEPENRRRGGNSGVQLLRRDDQRLPALFCKRQTGHLYRSLRHPAGRPTVLRELRAYQAFTRLGIRTPKLVFGGAREHAGQWQALLVTEVLDGFVSLDRWYAGAPSAVLVEAVLARLAESLARLHRARWQHGCCYPKHIFVKAEMAGADGVVADVALIDLEKCRRRLRIGTASSRDMAQLARHAGNMPAADLRFLQQSYAKLL